MLVLPLFRVRQILQFLEMQSNRQGHNKGQGFPCLEESDGLMLISPLHYLRAFQFISKP